MKTIVTAIACMVLFCSTICAAEIRATIIPMQNRIIEGMELTFSGYGEKGDFQVRSKVKKGGIIIFKLNNIERKQGFISVDNPKYKNWNYAELIHTGIIFGPNEKINCGNIYIGERIELTKVDNCFIINDEPINPVKYMVFISTKVKTENNKVVLPQIIRMINITNEKQIIINENNEIPIIEKNDMLSNVDRKFQVILINSFTDTVVQVRSYIYDSENRIIHYVSESNSVNL